MSDLSDIIGTLLLRNNCVVIPDFGGFVAKVVSAQIDVAKGVIAPPKKALSFNKNLNNNDGLLISTLTQERNISFDEASLIVSEKVREIRSTLNKGERVHFQNVGFLFTNKAGAVSFEQDRFFNLLLSSYGLSSVHFVSEEKEQLTAKRVKEKTKVVELNPIKKPVVNQKIESKDEVVQEESSKDKPKFKILKTVIKYAAAAVIIPIGFYSFWIPMKTDVLQSGVVYSQDFNPFNKSIEPLYDFSTKRNTIKIDSVKRIESMKEITSELSENTTVFSYPIDDDLFVPVSLNKDSKNTSEIKTEVLKNGYHLIVGCFGDKENATSLVEELNNQGFSSFIVDYHKGLHRVSAAHSLKKKKVLYIREKVTLMGLSSWVLKK
jgi:cell division septation protein DedD